MATIEVRRATGIDKAEAKRRAEALARKMEAKIGIDWRWKGDLMLFDATRGAAQGVHGSVSVDGSSVRVVLDLPPRIRAHSGAVADRLVDALNQLFL